MTFDRRHVRARAAALGIVVAALLAGGCNGDRAFAPVPDPNAPVAGGYSTDDLYYFHEVVGGVNALSSPDAYATATVRKWDRDARVALVGDATDVDRANLAHICAELTAAIGGPVRFAPDTTGRPNLIVEFGPRNAVAQFDDIAHYQLDGLTSYDLDARGYLDSVGIYISSALVFGDRYFVLRHELMHALGMPGHSAHFPESTMYGALRNGLLPDYAAIDLDAVEMLYRDEVRVGMTPLDAERVLRTLTRR